MAPRTPGVNRQRTLYVRGGGPERGRFPRLVADLVVEQRAVLQLEVAPADLDRAALLEIGEHSVHRHAGRADEPREILLGEIDLVAASGIGEVDEAFRHATRQVEEHEILDVTGAAAEHPHPEPGPPA